MLPLLPVDPLAVLLPGTLPVWHGAGLPRLMDDLGYPQLGGIVDDRTRRVSTPVADGRGHLRVEFFDRVDLLTPVQVRMLVL